jgi:hypothetical protein
MIILGRMRAVWSGVVRVALFRGSRVVEEILIQIDEGMFI